MTKIFKSSAMGFASGSAFSVADNIYEFIMPFHSFLLIMNLQILADQPVFM
jgi:hypothetical protein